MKTCTKCKIEQPLENFNKDRTHKEGYKSRCKTCRAVDRQNEPRVLARKEGVFEEAAPVAVVVEVPRELTQDELRQQVLSEAKRRALHKLVSVHQREFERYVSDFYTLLGGAKKWISVNDLSWDVPAQRVS